MTVEERVEQFVMLAHLSHWNRREMERQAKERYKNGPNPNGSGWTKEELDVIWQTLEELSRGES